MLINPLPTSYLISRLVVIIPVINIYREANQLPSIALISGEPATR